MRAATVYENNHKKKFQIKILCWRWITFSRDDYFPFHLRFLLVLSSAAQGFYSTIISLFLNINSNYEPLEITRYWLFITICSLCVSWNRCLFSSFLSFFSERNPIRRWYNSVSSSSKNVLSISLVTCSLVCFLLGSFHFRKYRFGTAAFLVLSLLSQVCLTVQYGILNRYVAHLGCLSSVDQSVRRQTPLSTPLMKAMTWRSIGTLMGTVLQCYLFFMDFTVSQTVGFAAVLFLMMIPLVWMLAPLSQVPMEGSNTNADTLHLVVRDMLRQVCRTTCYKEYFYQHSRRAHLQFSTIKDSSFFNFLSSFWRKLFVKKKCHANDESASLEHLGRKKELNRKRNLSSAARDASNMKRIRSSSPGWNKTEDTAPSASAPPPFSDSIVYPFSGILLLVLLFTICPESSAVHYHYLFSYGFATWFYSALTAMGYFGSAVGAFLFSKLVDYVSTPFPEKNVPRRFSSFWLFRFMTNRPLASCRSGTLPIEQRKINRFVFFASIGVGSSIFSHACNLILIYFFSAESFVRITKETGSPLYVFWWYVMGWSFVMGMASRLSFLPIMVTVEELIPDEHREIASEALGFVTAAGGVISAFLTHFVVVVILHFRPRHSQEDLLAWTAIICGFSKLLLVPIIVSSRAHQFFLCLWSNPGSTAVYHAVSNSEGPSSVFISQYEEEFDFPRSLPSFSVPAIASGMYVDDITNQEDGITAEPFGDQVSTSDDSYLPSTEDSSDFEIGNNKIRWGKLVFDVPEHYEACTKIE